MPTFNRGSLDREARKYGFPRDTFEKVLRLTMILEWMQTQEFLSQHLALKGGTAINLTLFHLPRLSVDIDLDFIPNLNREEMMSARESVTDLIKRYMESEGYALSSASRFHHSLDSFYFSYYNSAGNHDIIKIEINYSLRSHLFVPVKRGLTTDLMGNDLNVLTIEPMEIFAAKTNALLSRAAARDLYDFDNMIKLGMFEDNRDLFRKCIVFYSSISRESVDLTFDTSLIDTITINKIKRDLFPVLVQKERNEPFELDLIIREVKQYIRDLMKLEDSEKEYLVSFAKKKYLPELLFHDALILKNVESHPMALWKCREKE